MLYGILTPMIHRRITRNTMKRPAKMDLEGVCGIHNKRQMGDNLETTNQWLTKSVPKISFERLSREMPKA